VSELAYLGLGSNMGDRAANLARARDELSRIGHIIRHSSIYETEPWGVDLPQQDYLNQVIALETDLDAAQLLLTLQEIEKEMGRGPHGEGEPRVIDIDILLYGDTEIATVASDWSLFIPHPRMTERAFVLVPLLEIAPNLVHPGLGVRFRELVALLDTSTVRPWYG
jgi:2-amino-4-hydroxy-6-hydroxymethyldihydropteridine diphosphokinase